MTMELTYNGPFCYPANGHQGLRGGRCWLRLYSADRANVAIVTELDSNDGPSVTNAIESIRALVLTLGGRHIPLTLIDHYDDRISYGRPAGRPMISGVPSTRYSRVTFDERGVPTWDHISLREIEELLGGRDVADDLPVDPR